MMEMTKINSELLFRYGETTISEYFNMLDNLEKDIIADLFNSLLPDNLLNLPPLGRWWSATRNLEMLLNVYPKNININNCDNINLFTSLIIIAVYIMSSEYKFHADIETSAKFIYYAFNFSEMELDGSSIIVKYQVKNFKRMLPELIVLFNICLYMREIEPDIESISNVILKTKNNYDTDMDIRSIINKFEPNTRFCKRVMMNIRLCGV